MQRGILLFLILAILVVLAVVMGWIDFSGTSSSSRSTVSVSVDKDEVEKDLSKTKETVGRWSESAQEEARELAKKVEKATETEKLGLRVNKYAVQLDQGARVDVTVTRYGSDLKPATLKVTATPQSQLLVSGGTFEQGQAETTVTIEAPQGAVDGRVDLQLGDARESISVEVKSQPAAMWQPQMEWPRTSPKIRF